MSFTHVEGGEGGLVSAFEAPLPNLRRTALFLDLDGTLAAFQGRPDLVGPDPDRTALLHRLDAALDGRLAILSGRTIEDVDRILDGAVTAAAGVHGLQRRSASGIERSLPPHPKLAEAVECLRAHARAQPGLLLEEKPQSVALHYRNAPAEGCAVLRLAQALAAESGLVLQRGRLVAELRTPGADKGDALRAFMGEPPFSGFTPVMVGDDFTDEPAFAAARSLGGFGVLVGPPRPTAATSRLNGVDAVLAWLAAAADGALASRRLQGASLCRG